MNDTNATMPRYAIIQPLWLVELSSILGALSAFGWNRTRAASALGISTRKMGYKVEELRAMGINVPQPREAAKAGSPALTEERFPEHTGPCPNGIHAFLLPEMGLNLPRMLTELEKDMIAQALLATRGSRQRAADMLRMNRSTLVEKMRRHGFPLRGKSGPGIDAVKPAEECSAIAEPL